MNQEMNPMGQVEKKGMSKGCLVGLIVGIVLVVIVGLLIAMWIWKGDDVMKAGTHQFMAAINTELATNPVEGVDTVFVNSVSEAFRGRFDTSKVEMQKYGLLVQGLQNILKDKKVSAVEADEFIELMVDYYPELGELAPPEETWEDTTVVEDSLEQTE